MAEKQDGFTYNDLTSINRVEQNSTTLVAVRKDLYRAIAELQNSQAKNCEIAIGNPDSTEYDYAMDRKKTTNVCVRNLVYARIKKINTMALHSATGTVNTIDAMTPEEKEYYDTVVAASKKFLSLTDRKKKVRSVDITSEESIEKREPIVEEPIPEPEIQTSTETVPVEEIPMVDEEMAEGFPEEYPDEEMIEEPIPEPVIEEPVVEEPAVKEPVIEEPVQAVKEETVVIRILEDIPTFSGPDRDYTLKKEDVVRMPSMIAMALVNRGKATVIVTS